MSPVSFNSLGCLDLILQGGALPGEKSPLLLGLTPRISVHFDLLLLVTVNYQ